MAVENRIPQELVKCKPGLLFDSESVSLIGKYTDHISAYRARKLWIDVFGNHFLLDHKRDFEIQVNSSIEEKTFIVQCVFTSACGRYAFWRLVNHQAPEAEAKLGDGFPSANATSAKQSGGEKQERNKSETKLWIEDALEIQTMRNLETATLIRRLLKIFN